MSQSSSFSFGNLSFNSGSQSVTALQENAQKRSQGQQSYNHHAKIQQKKEEALRRREERRAGLKKLASAVQEKVFNVTRKLEASRKLRQTQNSTKPNPKLKPKPTRKSVNPSIEGKPRIRSVRATKTVAVEGTQSSLVEGSITHRAEQNLKEQLARAKKRRKPPPSPSQAQAQASQSSRRHVPTRNLVSSQASQRQFKLPQPRAVSAEGLQKTCHLSQRIQSTSQYIGSPSSQHTQGLRSVSQVQAVDPVGSGGLAKGSQVVHSQYNFAKPQAVAQSFNAPIGLLLTQSFAGDAGQVLGMQPSSVAQQTTTKTSTTTSTTSAAPPQDPKPCNPLRRIPGPIGDIVRSDGDEGQSQSALQKPHRENSLLEQRPWKSMMSLLNGLNRATQTLERVASEDAGYRAQAVRVCILKMKHLEAGAFAIVTDESGQMEAEIHKDAVDTFPLSLVEGACLLVENAAVFRPFDQYSCASPQLIVLPRNILHIFAPNPSCDVDLGLLNTSSCGPMPVEHSQSQIISGHASSAEEKKSEEDEDVRAGEEKSEEPGNSMHDQLVEAIKQSQMVKTQKPLVQDEDEAETRREVQQMAMDTFACSDDDEELEDLFGSPAKTVTFKSPAKPAANTASSVELIQAREEKVETNDANKLNEWIDDDDDDDMENLF